MKETNTITIRITRIKWSRTTRFSLRKTTLVKATILLDTNKAYYPAGRDPAFNSNKGDAWIVA
jgi:hypothetical protein